MRFISMLGWLACAGVGVGCAGTNAAGLPVESPARIYTDDEIRLLMHLRDNGDGLSDVAKVIGGTRRDVKRAEAWEKQRRRLAGRARPPETTTDRSPSIAQVGS